MNPLPVGKNALIRAARRAHKPGLSLFVLALLCACGGSPADGLGVRDGRLQPCPSSPNCVNSQAADAEHHVAPLPLLGDADGTRTRLLELLAAEPRVKVVAEQERYIRAEFTSRVLRFVDDVEFVIGAQAVDVRSASRMGKSDMGVNRERVEHLRQRLSAPGLQAPGL